MTPTVFSFGYKYNDNPDPAIPGGRFVMDIQQLFRNPHKDPTLRQLDGRDDAVQQAIRATPHFWKVVGRIVTAIQIHHDVREVWIGCRGGHHRSVYIAQLVGYALDSPVIHRDVDRVTYNTWKVRP